MVHAMLAAVYVKVRTSSSVAFELEINFLLYVLFHGNDLKTSFTESTQLTFTCSK